MKKRIAPLCAALALLFCVVGCGAGSYTQNLSTSSADAAPQMTVYGETAAAREEAGVDYEAEEPMDAEDDIDYADAGGDMLENPNTAGIAAEVQERKIVYTMDLSLQTTAFDDGVAAIAALTEEIGGFVQHSYVEGTNIHQKYYSRSASFTVRVPADKLDAYIAGLGENFHVVYQQKSSNDITAGYYDTQARLRSLEVQRDRLMEMLEGATELQYMLEVERELSSVLYQIDSITSSLQQMDDSVSMSTVTIQLQEVSAVEENQPVTQPVTFGERIREAFGDSWDGFVYFCQGFVLFLIALLPYIPVLVVIAIAIVLIVRARRKRRAKRTPPVSGPPTVVPYIRPDAEKDKSDQDTPPEPPAD